MRGLSRRGTLRVKDGRVQKKNNWLLTPNYYSHDQPLPVVDRKRPSAGYRHVLKQKDIYDFIAILPNWTQLSQGLNAIVLSPGGCDRDGYHELGVVHVCAWEDKLWTELSTDYYSEHQDIFERLGVSCEPHEDGWMMCRFTENQIRAYQLLHILLHELGHHHDRMTTRSKTRSARGEPYAEAYAREHEAVIWQQYLKKFLL